MFGAQPVGLGRAVRLAGEFPEQTSGPAYTLLVGRQSRGAEFAGQMLGQAVARRVVSQTRFFHTCRKLRRFLTETAR